MFLKYSNLKFRAKITLLLFIITSLLFISESKAQLIIKTNRTVTELVKNVLADKGIKIDSITNSANLSAIGFFDGRKSNLGLDSGILLSTGLAENAVGPNTKGNTSTSNNQPGDISITNLNPSQQNVDAAWIRFIVTPESDTLKFRFVFASEEYPEYVGRDFNDLFGLFIQEVGSATEQNLALIPGTAIPISIQTINNIDNNNYYIDNTNGQSVSFDGFTTIFEIKSVVIPCKDYSLKFVIADLKDYIFDSGIFIEALSLKSINKAAVTANAANKSINECDSNYLIFTRNSDDLSSPLTVKYKLSGTAVNSIDYNIENDSVAIIPINQKSIAIKIDPITDGIAEPAENIIATITSPIICDTQQVNIILADYKNIDSLQFKFVCNDSVSFVYIKDADFLDSVYWVDRTGFLLSNAKYIAIPKSNTDFVFVHSIEKCTGRAIIDSIRILNYSLSVAFDSIICYGDEIQLSVSSLLPNARYEWSTNTNGSFFPNQLSSAPKISPKQTGTITVNIINDGVCATKTVFVKVIKLEVADTLYSICSTTPSIQLNAYGGKKYKWTPSAFLTSDTIGNPLCTANTDIEYSVYIENEDCNITFPVRITIDTPITVKASSDIYICDREFAKLHAIGSPTNTYVWIPSSGLDSPFAANPQANPTVTTKYFVMGYNGNCTNIDSVTVFVVNPITSLLSYSFDSCSKIFYATEINADEATEVTWELSDGTIKNGKSISHQFSKGGNYNIKAIVNPSAPCADTSDLNLYFPSTDVESRKIPSAFSPNGDGINDDFKIYFGNLSCAIEEFKIFNRWGQLVYEHLSGNTLSWDGKLNGQFCEAGIYVYHLKGEGFEDVGWVALVR